MSAKRKLLIIDTETGGLDPMKQSILSLGAVVWNQGSIDDTFYVEIAEPEIIAEEAALKVNGMVVDTLREQGSSPSLAIAGLENFLLKNNLGTRVTLAGHNVSFDVGFLQRLYRLAAKDYGKRFSHRALCTMTAAMLLEQAGKLDQRSLGLNALCAAYGIVIREEGKEGRHNALEDAVATAKLLTKLLSLL